jgi:hypothetical protein
VSGLVAGLFIFAMLFTVGTGFFIFVNDVNTSYVKSLSARSSAMQDQLSESVQVSAGEGAGHHLTLTFRNDGGVSANVTDVLVVDPAGALHAYGIGFTSNLSPELPAALNVADESPSLDTNLTIVSGTYTIKAVTQRGNSFATTYPPPQASTITTALSALVITAGQSVFDTSTLAGVTSSAGGNVTYSYFSGAFCDGSASIVSTVRVTDAVVPDSDPQTFNTVGVYSWHAVYLGDPNNNGATSPCEPLSVILYQPCNPDVQTCLASTASGLGFLSLDYNSFHAYNTTNPSCMIPATPSSSCQMVYYKPGGIPGGAKFSVANAPFGYTLHQAGNLVFSVNVTNTDPAGRTLVLDPYSLFYFFALTYGSSSSFKNTVWLLGQANSLGQPGLNINPSTGIVVPPPTCSNDICIPNYVTVFFVNEQGCSIGAGSCSIPNLFAGTFYLHGILGYACTTLAGAGCVVDPLDPQLPVSMGIGQNEPTFVTLFR